LALRVSHRSHCLFNALQMVPSAGALTAVGSAAPRPITRRRAISRCAEDDAPTARNPQIAPTPKSCA
jgi:hypothetical protein